MGIIKIVFCFIQGSDILTQMRLKLNLLYLIFIIGLFSFSAQAQVTIGSEKSPVKGALLQLKENEELTANSNKGLLLPRVYLNSSSDFDPVLAGATAAEKTEHVGLMVYHVGSQNLCAGVYVWNNIQWSRLPDSCEVMLLCETLKLEGNFFVGTPLDVKSKITVDIVVPKSSVGGTYHIYTDTQNGMSFSATGTLAEGAQTITLAGTGAPRSGGVPFKFTIYAEYSNSESNPVTCSLQVSSNTIPIATANTFGFGYYNNDAGYYGYYSTNQTGSRKMLTSVYNFGNAGISAVKSSGFVFADPAVVDGLDVNNFINSKGWKSNPDVIIHGYHSNTSNTVVIDSLVAYLKRGGTLILFDEYGNGANSTINISRQICQKLFPTSSISIVAGGTSGATSTISSSIDDEITNGAFGSIKGTLWGHDASTSIALKGLPADSIVAYSTGTYVSTLNATAGDATAVSMFRHKRLNLFFCGDGGFLANPAGATGNNPVGATATTYPFAIDASSKPIMRTGWGYNSSKTIYNSIIFANVMAWAVKHSKSNNR